MGRIYLGADTEQEFHMLHKATLTEVDNPLIALLGPLGCICDGAVS